MGCFHILWSLVVGLVVGLIARAVVPGAEQMGLIMTALLGIVGSLVGGFIGGVLSKPKEGSKFHPAGFFLSIIGAVLVLFLWNVLRH